MLLIIINGERDKRSFKLFSVTRVHECYRRMTDHTTEKCVAISKITAISPKKSVKTENAQYLPGSWRVVRATGLRTSKPRRKWARFGLGWSTTDNSNQITSCLSEHRTWFNVTSTSVSNNPL